MSAPPVCHDDYSSPEARAKGSEEEDARALLIEEIITCGRAETCAGLLRLERTPRMHPHLAAHFTKERSSKTTAQRDFGTVYQFHYVVSVKERM
jgi:hypothetical protein